MLRTRFFTQLYFYVSTFLILVMLCQVSVANDMKTTVGLVKEKPKTGRFVKTDQGYMIPYKTKIPGSDVTFEMVPIPGGTFILGSPKSEKGRAKSEGPQVKVTVAPFWMSKHELTWAEYKEFIKLHDIFKDFATLRNSLEKEPTTAQGKENLAALKKIIDAHPLFKKQIARKKIQIDAITAPSNLYDPTYTYKNGEKPNLPAVTMSQYAAKQYTKWISRTTGNFYRLPSETQWEYACRAGSKTAYHFGDDVTNLSDYAWCKSNSKKTTHPVGSKKPNAWGLYDMHGNVAEWVMDGYEEEGYKKYQGKICWPSELYPRVVRGGSFEFEAKACRSASRFESEDDDWRDEDPNFPQSPWWFTNEPTLGIGFRMIRPLNAPKDKKDQEKFWQSDNEELTTDVKDRLTDGKGALGHVDPQLPKVIKILPLIMKKQKALEKK